MRISWLLSGIKHFCFCQRRWALVHIEQQWQENALTVSGHLIHERVHDENFTESRGSVLLRAACRYAHNCCASPANAIS